MSEYLDLSHTLNNQTPVYPGDPAVEVSVAGSIPSEGYRDHKVVLGTHIGTHIDAPAHMIDAGTPLKDYSLDRFIGRAYCVDGFDLESLRNLTLTNGDIVLFATGMSKQYHDPEYFTDFPVMSHEIVDYLIEKQVKLVGIDTGSADCDDGFPVHKELLGADILIVENLTNLDSLIGQTFDFMALPLKLEHDGAPVRAVATNWRRV